jgi:hypothetical protein
MTAGHRDAANDCCDVTMIRLSNARLDEKKVVDVTGPAAESRI